MSSMHVIVDKQIADLVQSAGVWDTVWPAHEAANQCIEHAYTPQLTVVRQAEYKQL